MNDAQINHMVDRFLSWKLPEHFSPDGGINFKGTFNDHLPVPMKHEPSGTNLFSATQATAMIEHLLDGLPGEDPAAAFDMADYFWRTLDPEDSGDHPSEALNRGMVSAFTVCEVASSYSGPTRFGFIAPVLDAESDDEEFLHFATQAEAMKAAGERLAAIEKMRTAEAAPPKQYGFTQSGPTPGFVNVQALDNGKMRIAVRSDGDGNTTGWQAFIDLDRIDYANLRNAMLEVSQP